MLLPTEKAKKVSFVISKAEHEDLDRSPLTHAFLPLLMEEEVFF